jgi:EEF1A N-terminal glycine/lysine methyltransferase
MLTSRIHVPSPSDREPEDIFQSSLATLFTDDIQNSHGSPGGTLMYESPYYGEIKIHLPKHPDLNAERQLFAHYLWNAGILVADFIEQASHCVEKGIEHASTKFGQGFWNVRGERVLELGAGW